MVYSFEIVFSDDNRQKKYMKWTSVNIGISV